MDMTKRRLASIVSSLAREASRSPFWTTVTIRDRQANFLKNFSDSFAYLYNVLFVFCDEISPAISGQFGQVLEPIGIQFMATAVLREISSTILAVCSKAQQFAFKTDHPLVELK